MDKSLQLRYLFKLPNGRLVDQPRMFTLLKAISPSSNGPYEITPAGELMEVTHIDDDDDAMPCTKQRLDVSMALLLTSTAADFPSMTVSVIHGYVISVDLALKEN